MVQENISDKLKNLKSQSLSKVVEEQLEQMIISGELQPGERINESALSNLLQISRAPIREACRQLSQYGMVENRVGKGSYVREVNLQNAVELYEIRGALDALAVELVCQRISNEEVNELKNLVDQMRKFAEDEASTEYFSTNLKFHQMIVRLSRNEALIELYEVVFRKLSLFRQKTLAQPSRLQASLAQHEGILRAIVNRDEKLAVKLARSHVEEAKVVLLIEKQ
jgi:DNA-binding GntR family transcriptional regulator